MSADPAQIQADIGAPAGAGVPARPLTNRAVQGLGWAALSGILFGSINVAVKVRPIHPVLQSALAYLAVAAVLLPFLRGLRVAPADRLRMAAMAVIGGAISPVLLFYGLRETAAVDSGLILTLELVVTAILAAIFLHERERARGWFGLACLLAAAILAAAAGTQAGATSARGALLVAASAAGWGIDNVLSTRLVGTYRPTQILAVKGLVGGLCALALALALQAEWPQRSGIAWALTVGAFGLAGSLVCFYQALRRIGAARTSAVNIPLTALASAAGGFLFLREPLTLLHGAALLSLLLGVLLLASATTPQGSSTGAK